MIQGFCWYDISHYEGNLLKPLKVVDSVADDNVSVDFYL